jgi:hypothetical protein
MGPLEISLAGCILDGRGIDRRQSWHMDGDRHHTGVLFTDFARE